MMKVDYHVHSKYSFDGKDTLEDICRQATAMYIDEICFTEHFAVDPLDVSYNVLNYQAYSESIESSRIMYKDDLVIKRGLEIGEPHLTKYKKDLQDALRKMDLDFIIGSVHNLSSKKLRLNLPGKTKDEIYRDYFMEILHMVNVADIDVVGHLDLMKRYAFKDFGNYVFEEYRDVIRAILEKMIAREIGLEINTAGFRNDVKESYPTLDILTLYKSLGGRLITIGSDTHDTANLGKDWDSAVLLLKQAGFTSFFVYTKRIKQEVPLE